METARRNVLGQFSASLAGLGDAAIIADVNGKIVFLNSAAEGLTGWTQDVASGEQIDRVLQIVDEASGDRVAVRQGPLPAQAQLMSRGNAARRVVGSCTAIRDEAGDQAGWICVLRDVGEREDLIRAALAHAQHIIATVREPLLVLDKSLRVVSANRAFYQTFRVSEQDTANRMIYELGNGQWDIPRLRELLEGVLPHDESFEGFEVEHEFPEIGVRSMLLNARRLPPWGGQDAKILLAIEDITHRKRAEEELERQRVRLQKAVNIEAVSVLFFEASTGILIDANETFLKQSGFTPQDLRSRELTWQRLTPPEYRDASLEQLEGFAETGRIGPYEKEYFRKDGSRWWMLFSGAALDEATIIEFCIDITQIKEAERNRAESEARYRRLFEAAREGILIVSGDTGRIIDANPYVGELLGYERGAFLGKELWEIGLLRDKEESQRAFEALQQRGYIRYEHLPLETKAGGTADVEFVSNVYEVNGKRIIQCNIRDISDRTLLNRVQQQAQELAEAGHRRDEFLAMLSHELRNPLAPMASAVSLLRLRRDGSDIEKEAVDVLERQLLHLTHLVDDLLEVSRITSGRIRLKREKVVLNNVMRDAVEMVRPLTRTRGQEVVLTMPQTPVWVNADSERLGQVISNLLTNAIKYSDPGSPITISAEEAGGEARLAVTDAGIGISAELLPHVFGLFSQGAQSLARSTGGLGIGLAIARTLTEMHGGRIEAFSRGEGLGSTFVVHLPLASPMKPIPSVRAEVQTTQRESSRLRVLVVDDNQDAARMLGRLVQAGGHQVCTAFSGSEALRALREYRPDIALLDIGLPEMDGYEIARLVRKDPSLRNLVLVAISGYGREADRLRSRESGFDHHLVKPADIGALRKILREAEAADRA